MLAVDIVAIVLLLAGAFWGVRRGLVTNFFTVLGLFVGGFTLYWVIPPLGAVLPWPVLRAAVLGGTAAAVFMVTGIVGGRFGLFLRRHLDHTQFRLPDRILGGVSGFVIAGIAVAAVGSSLALTGVPALSLAVATSPVLRAIETVTPDPVSEALAELHTTRMGGGLRELALLLPGSLLPPPTPVALDDPRLVTAAESVARISGTAFACGTTLSGSGFVIAADHVLTNAHVVAGVARPLVELPGQTVREGRVVYFNAMRDIAVIAVDDLGAASLTLSNTLGAGTAAVVDGYPFGGGLAHTAANVLSVGAVTVPDIYGRDSSMRDVYALEADVQPGDSGGPLLTADATVAGVVFARGNADAGRGYAMTSAEVAPLVARAPAMTDEVSTGHCLG